MTILDYIIILVLLFHALRGLKKGFMTILFDFISIGGSLFVAIRYYEKAGYLLKNAINLKLPSGYVVCLGGILLFMYIFLSLVNKLINRLIDFTGLGLPNKVGGLIMGVSKGMIYLLVIITPLMLTNSKMINESTIIKPYMPLIEGLYVDYVPDNVRGAKIKFPDLKSFFLGKNKVK